MRQTRRVPTLWFALALGLGACASVGPPPTSAPAYRPVDESHPGAKLVLGAPDLWGRVIVAEPQLRKQGALTEAGVAVQNLSGGTYVLEYLFEWEDASGFTVDDVKVWRRFTLTPHQISKFTSMGPSPDAARMTFTIRYPESTF